jgi:nucleoside-triphosphatase THEP1
MEVGGSEVGTDSPVYAVEILGILVEEVARGQVRSTFRIVS